jgi:hypothetical protein
VVRGAGLIVVVVVHRRILTEEGGVHPRTAGLERPASPDRVIAQFGRALPHSTIHATWALATGPCRLTGLCACSHSAYGVVTRTGRRIPEAPRLTELSNRGGRDTGMS